MTSSITPVFPDIHTGLDVWHMVRRYTGAVVGKSTNSSSAQIGAEVSLSILEKRACESETGIAIYRCKEEQQQRLEATFQKWDRDHCWSPGAHSVHKEQTNHVQKGCLTRVFPDLRSDGSRIENLHRHLNKLQRCVASGLEIIFALLSDFVLRWNVRIGTESPPGSDDICHSLLQWAFGSHHIRLVSHIAEEMNKHSAFHLGILPLVESNESFGLAKSETTLTFGGLLAIKDEE
ncbi:hypothetical protein BDZ89DRAFT_1145024 [Hymenopellis radicata]|nr:hypothetical protein BDZ89DRAFT_1145024 [Hymenopellis radicata]